MSFFSGIMLSHMGNVLQGLTLLISLNYLGLLSDELVNIFGTKRLILDIEGVIVGLFSFKLLMLIDRPDIVESIEQKKLRSLVLQSPGINAKCTRCFS